MAAAPTTLGIAGATMTASVDPRGAQLMSLCGGEKQELLWQGDPQFWADRALTLFPIIGPPVDGQLHRCGATYTMPPHGFAHLRDSR